MPEYPPIYAYLDGIARGRREALDQAAEQIKALPIYGLKFLYRDDVLSVLAGLRGDDG